MRMADACSCRGAAPASPPQLRTTKQRCRGGSSEGAAGRWTRVVEQRSSKAELKVRPPPSLSLSPLPRTAKRRCRAGSTAGAAGRWTRAESAPSGGRGSSAAFSLPLSSPALAVNDPHARFPTRRSYLGARAVDFPRGRAPFGALPLRPASGVRGAVVGVRPTPLTPRRRLTL